MAEQQPVFCDNSSNKSGHSAEKEEQIDSASLNSISEPIQSFNKIKKQESKSSITEQPDSKEWLQHEKHFFILSNSGKPIWTRYITYKA